MDELDGGADAAAVTVGWAGRCCIAAGLPCLRCGRSLCAASMRNLACFMIDHLARHAPDPATRTQICEATVDRGLYYEFHIDETPRDLWMINGMWPPASGSEAEQLWARENRPVPY
ncbi:tautomerase family protein [Dactylosporangium sp. CA-139066]|uniref:tautomerase family protein n=1 Tax=Dactylosporangium sp. CA-139066 TaxID=3239930 RepID=UPI003D8E3CBB